MSSIAEKYQKLDDISHVLLRPGMYVGSIKPKEDTVYVFQEGAMVQRRVVFNPAFLKIFDEILSNSGDEHRRNPKLNHVQVRVDVGTGTLSIRDNGGIPVVMHPEHQEWVPELIFSNLKAGSNFNDDEARLVAGTNGVGSTLTNIYSQRFQVETCDGKNRFSQEFRNNMRDRDVANVTPYRGKGFTQITFQPDLARFGLEGIDTDHLDMLQKRCIEMAACNPNLRVDFEVQGAPVQTFHYPTFKQFCALFAETIIYDEDSRWKVGVRPSEGAFTQVSFVNSVETSDGGTHVDYVLAQIVAWLREKIKKKYKFDLKPAEIKNHLFVVVQADVVNPAFSSQTKEKLITEPRDFGSKWVPKDKFLKAIYDSEIIQRILDWVEQKQSAEERKSLREANKKLSKESVLKLIDAKAPRNREECTLAIYEGDSAVSAFRKYRNPMLQGAFPLRGKVLNVSGMSAADIVKNQEIKSLLVAIGLKLGEPPEDLRYGKILIYADADPDGDSITGLLVNFFGRFWPDLLAQGRLMRVMTPLVVVKKGGTTIPFYTQSDFSAWQGSVKDLPKWDIAYKKGLAALEEAEYKEIIVNPKMFAITPGGNLQEILDCWFAKDSAPRKAQIMAEGGV